MELVNWIVQDGSGYRIKGIRGFIPENALVELPEGISVHDQAFLILEENTDPNTGEISYDVSIDQGSKDAYLSALLIKEAREGYKKILVARADFVKDFKAEISLINLEKGWNITQTLQYLEDPTIQKLMRLLDSTALETSRDILEISDVSGFYTEDEKNYFIQILTDYLAREQG